MSNPEPPRKCLRVLVDNDISCMQYCIKDLSSIAVSKKKWDYNDIAIFLKINPQKNRFWVMVINQ